MTTDTIILTLAGDQYEPAGDANLVIAEVWAISSAGTVKISNPTETVAAVHGQGAQGYVYNINFGDPTQARAIGIWLKNDAYGGSPSMDRNLYLMGVTVNGVYFPPGSANEDASDNDNVFISIPANTAFPPGYVAAPPPPVYATPSFRDSFATDVASRWMTFDGSHWPPASGSSGIWCKMLQQGWPTNSGSQDPSARTEPANHEAEGYEDANVTIASGGGCNLTSTRGADSHFPSLPFTSGCITQNQDLAAGYGYFEIVAELPGLQGTWAAFWLLPKGGGWASEIDIFEAPNVDGNNNQTTTQVHVGNINNYDASANGAFVTIPSGGAVTGLHKYGLLFDATHCTYYIDDVQVQQFPTPPMAVGAEFYILANLAIGGPGSWPGVPAAGMNSANMFIKRISQYNAGTWGSSTIPVTEPVTMTTTN